MSGVTNVGVETPNMSSVSFSSSRSFGPGTPMQLDADAHEADVVDVRRDVRPRPGEAHPGAEGARLRVDAAPHVLGQVVADDELGADDPVRLRVPAALEVAGVPEPLHLRRELVDDRLEALLLVRLDPLLGEPEALVLPLQVDQERRQRRERAAEELVEERPEERIEAALEVDEEERRRARSG